MAENQSQKFVQKEQPIRGIVVRGAIDAPHRSGLRARYLWVPRKMAGAILSESVVVRAR